MKNRIASLLSVVIFCLVGVSVFAQTQGVLRQVYSGIPGTLLRDLTQNPNFPNNPTSESILSDFFEAPIDVEDNYGQRLMALITPPVTGNYTFWISGDDESALYLSTDDQPANKTLIARVPGWTPSRVWNWDPQQQSASISLQSGRKYYIEALMKEGSGGDNLAVRWQLPNGSIEEPIPGSRLQVYGMGPPIIVQPPASQTVFEGAQAVFSVQANRTTGMSYQWQKNGVNISGATSASLTVFEVRLSESGTRYRCVLVNAQGSVTSNEALLTVLPDTTPPVLEGVTALGDPDTITVLFSEPVEASSAQQNTHYTLNNGASVKSAMFAGDTRTIVLKTSPLEPGIQYVLSVSHVRDRATTPNTISPGSQRSFTLSYAPLDMSLVVGNREPLGPSSRRTGLVISEIMYHPADRADGRRIEFVELYNTQDWPEDLSGFRLLGDVDFVFPEGTSLAARSFLVVAAVPADIRTVYGINNVVGPYTGNLANDNGSVGLRTKTGAVLLEVAYSSHPPYPMSADGAGHSLVLSRPSWGENHPQAWMASALSGGSPGTAEPTPANPYRTVVINEFLAHTDLPDLDFVEFYNYSAQAVSLEGCIITDDPATSRFVVPTGTVIPPLGHIAWDESQLGFRLSSAGEHLFLLAPGKNYVIDAIEFGATANGISTGRFPDGHPAFQELTLKTPGTANSRPLSRNIVINEIQYHPLSGDNDDEFIELFNKGSQAVDIGGWAFVDGIEFTFPPSSVIPANGYVVVAKNATRLRGQHPYLNTANSYGDFSGSLANGGERVALAMPHPVVVTNIHGILTTNYDYVVVDEVTYGDGGRWGQWSDGGGSSLELKDARSDNRLAANWTDSDESTKASWMTVQYTGTLDNGNGAANSLQILALGAGEFLVDDIEVFRSGGPNLVVNPGFDNGLDGWVPQGNHNDSAIDSTGGTGNGRCLHVRATGRGDTGANRIRTPLSSSLSSGNQATLRAKVRWLKGHPEILLRLHGNWIEATNAWNPPENLGTPGLRNSRAVLNAGPAISRVNHSPALPAANQAVTITAQVNDPDGLAMLILNYRIDPSTNLTRVPMVNNGAGCFSTTLPGQSAGKLAAFHITAADASSNLATSQFPEDAPRRECLVLFGDTQPAGNLGAYHLWITQATATEWARREKNSNKPLDGTFVYGNHRVIYNIGTLYSGSPFHTGSYNGPMGNTCDYIANFPSDDPLLGATDFVLATVGNLANDNTAQREQVAFWMLNQMGLPYLHRRYVHVYVNGQRRSTIYEDCQQPNSDVIQEWFSNDPAGQLFKIEDWFEFDDAGSGFNSVDATLQRFTTTGGLLNTARYRWNWRKRAVQDSANHYADFLAMVEAVNAPNNVYTDRVLGSIDVDQWMRTFATEHVFGNWDSYGHRRGKNMYTYKPQQGRWQMITWDNDWVLGANSDSPTENLFVNNDPTIDRMYQHPPFRRMYYRALYDATQAALAEAKVGPWMDARYAGLRANNVNVSSPTEIKNWINQRRAYVQQQLAAVNASFAITSNGGQNFTTNKSLITLAGTAPVGIKTIEVNNIAYPVTWISVTEWTLSLPLASGSNLLTIKGYDTQGNLYANATDSVSINNTSVPDPALDNVVINEIMYHPALPGAGYVELFNRSTSTTYDLSSWRLNGVDFVFPEGILLKPQNYLLVIEDSLVFSQVYGVNLPVCGQYSGALDRGGETLTLLKPGSIPTEEFRIDEVTYDDRTPWPTVADGLGPSLQLIDAAQDNNRVANWAASSTNAPVRFTPGSANSLRASLPAMPTLWLNEVHAQNLTGPVTAAGQREPWIELHNSGTSPVSLSQFYLTDDYAQPQRWNFPATAVLNPGQFAIVWCDGQTQGATTEWHANFSLAPESGSVALVRLQNGQPAVLDYLNYDQVVADYSYGAYPDGQRKNLRTFHTFTPAAPNNPADPPAQIMINEWMASNSGVLADPADGQFDDWFELYNGGQNIVDLSRFFLTDNPTNTTKFQIPHGTRIAPGAFLLIWADEDTEQNREPDEIHANFKLSQTGEYLGLFSPQGQLINEVTFGPQTNNISQGRWPDGHPSSLFFMSSPTPRAANVVPGSTATNAAPILAKLDDQIVNENHALTFVATATDEDLPAQRLTFSLDPGAPAGATIQPATGQFSWVPSEAQGPGLHTVSVRVTDNGTPARSASQSFNVTVNEVNASPLLTPIGIQYATEGQKLQFSVPVNDPDLPPQILTFGLEGGAPEGASVHPVTGLFTWTPTQTQVPSTNQVIFRITDNGNPPLSAVQTVTVIASAGNHPPVFPALADQTFDEMTAFSIRMSATDIDPGQTLTYTIEAGAQAGMDLNPATGVFTWTPTEAQGPATNAITIKATDNGSPNLSASQILRLLVREVNRPPIITGPNECSVAAGSTLSLSLSATDPDSPANSLSFSLEAGFPAGMTLNASSGLLTWVAPIHLANTTQEVGVRVTDNGIPAASDLLNLTVRVMPPERWRYVTVTGAGSASLLYVYLDKPGDAYIDDLRLVAGQTAEVGINLLKNGDFESALTEGWTLSPNHANSRLTSTPRHSGANSLHLIASSEGATRDSSIYQLIVPALSQNTNYTLSFWCLPGTNQVNLMVRLSGNGIVSSNNLVPLVNQPPVLSAIPDLEAQPGETLAFVAAASDPDPEQTLLFSLEPGAPAGAIITTDGRFSWTPSTNQANATHTITVRVTDNGSPAQTAVRSFSVRVAPSLPWRYVSVTGTASSSTLYVYLDQAGEAYIDDLKLVAGSVPETGTNLIQNGDFESA
ncbi:MAG TPA: lamin tail domain-containing protein, partial [Verrucomicrobiota bacterium]|nr:lamin tail domain-containing protein [Verrucomicrobiota bacterium]